MPAPRQDWRDAWVTLAPARASPSPPGGRAPPTPGPPPAQRRPPDRGAAARRPPRQPPRDGRPEGLVQALLLPLPGPLALGVDDPLAEELDQLVRHRRRQRHQHHVVPADAAGDQRPAD